MPPTVRCTATLSSSCAKPLCRAASLSRSFSTSLRNEQRTTRARKALFRWLGTQGVNFFNPLPGSTNYLNAYNTLGQLKRVVEAEKEKDLKKKKESESKAVQSENDSEKENKDGKDGEKKDGLPPETMRDRIPFPLNRHYVSHPVLDEMVKEEIWFRVMIEAKSVREVSSELGIEMARVGAVVRLKEIEKEWARIGKPLASAYQRAVLKMLPKTLLAPIGEKVNRHESINDLPVHRATGQQIFHPTSESRHFTRVDAARVFDERLLPADSRVPHPELVMKHKEANQELPREQIEELTAAREAIAEQKRISAIKRQEKKEAAVKKVDSSRWTFHFTEVQVDDAGKTGRGHKGTGWRYGVPLMDRSRGQVKIPTSVE
ncbi:hypothetical protein PZA11_007420 [Diplocarpon coronariae]